MMTLIQCYDPNRLENLAGCLRLMPEKLYLLGDGEQMSEAITQYEEVLKLRGQNLRIRPRSITGFSIAQVAKLLKELTEWEHDPVIDLTGGDIRVVMAAGALLASEKTAGRLRVQRYDPVADEYVDCDGDGRIRPGKEIALTAEQLITLYGGTIHPQKPPFPANYTARALEPLWSVVRSGPKDWNHWMRQLADLESRAGFAMEIDLEVKKLYSSMAKYADNQEELEMIRKKLSDAGVIEDQSTPSRIRYRYTKPLFRYCTKKAGNTLEVKTLLEARSLRENGKPYFDDCQMSVNIDWDGEIHKPGENEAETRNEVDLILTRGTKSLFISCKNGNIDDQELYKLNTVATKFGGPYARKMLVATNLDRGSAAGNRFFEKRAWDMGVVLISEAAALSRAEWEEKLKGAMERGVTSGE